MKQFNSAYPISGEDPSTLPVKATAGLITFYQSVLGFSVVAQNEFAAGRGGTTPGSGWSANPTTSRKKPERLGAFGVANLDAKHQKLDGRGLDLGGIRIDERGGKKYRAFFLREA
jgi:lactoylglutathione lyase